MNICLYRIDYTIDGNHEFTVNILAENGDAAIKKIVQVLQKQITIRTIDTVCVGIQLATEAIEKLIAEPFMKKNPVITQKAVEKIESPKVEKKVDGRSTRVFRCKYCDYVSKSGFDLAAHKKAEHFLEWTREQEAKVK